MTGRRARDPSKTGTATRKAVSMADRPKVSQKRGANALTKPHLEKQRVKDRVDSTTWHATGSDDCDWFIDSANLDSKD